MLPPLRFWTPVVALIVLGCRESETPADPKAIPPADPSASSEVQAEEEDPPPPPDFVEPLSLAHQALQESERGNDAEALKLYLATLESLPKDAEQREPEFVAWVHDGLGRAYQADSLFDEAELHLTTGWRIRAGLCDADPENVESKTGLGISVGHLGLLDLVRGRYASARRRFQEAMSLTPENRPDLLAHRYDCLGRYHLTLRSPQRALDDYRKAVHHAERSDSLDPSFLPDLKANLALCHFRLGNPAIALEQVESLFDELQDEELSLRLAELLNLSGTILASLDQLGEAEARIRIALQIVAELKGDEHVTLTTYLSNLASIKMKAGEFSGALEPLEQARALLRRHVEQHHQALVETLYQIAICKLETGPPAEARQAVVEARLAAGKFLAKLVATGSERELLNFRRQVDLHSLVCRLADPELIGQSLLDGKGRIMEAVLERRIRFAPRTAKINQLQSRLDALLLLDSAPPETIAHLRKQIEDLTSATLSPPPDPPSTGSWEQIQQALPPRTVFVDCVRFVPAQEEAPRYGAVLYASGQAPRWIPLGTERFLLYRLRNLHDSLKTNADILRSGGAAQGVIIAQLLELLHEAYWAPLAAAFPGDTREVILCPEGQMHLLPFAVLKKPEGRFLCQELDSLHLLPSARVLFRPPAPALDLSQPWAILGITDFGPHRSLQHSGTHEWISEWAESLDHLNDLPTVSEELSYLRARAPGGSVILTGGQAGQAALTALPSPPAVLHLASHGFHVPLEESRDLSADPATLYESGILVGLDHHGDGILFPEEAAALDLRGTELVTLSTCRSALGRPVSGEGLLGFRRAFGIAGAHHILASLWEIPDQTTAEFMRQFYRNLSPQQSPQRSLWKLQASHFDALHDEDEKSIKFERAILSYGGFLVTSPGGLPLSAPVAP